MHDALTGALNQQAFSEALRKEIIRAKRASTPLAVLYIDVDDFKAINDAQGHQKGDEVLRLISRSLRQCSREIDIIARLGGDEFCVVLPGVDGEGANAYRDRFVDKLGACCEGVGVSIGISVAGPEDYAKPEAMISAADSKMYSEKSLRHERESYETPCGASMRHAALELGMFPLAEVEAIEESDFGESEPPDHAQLLGASPWLDVRRMPANELGDRPSTVANAAVPIVPPVSAREGSDIGVDQGASRRQCEVFRAMPKLTADEVSIAFVGDKTESGIGANNMLEISARRKTKRVALAEIELVDRRSGTLNRKCGILLGMAQGKRFKYSGPNAMEMSRLRAVLVKHLGINGNPFDPYRKSTGWEARFKIYDKRGALDERAKREAEIHTTSYGELGEHGVQDGDTEQERPSFDPEDDEAGRYISQKPRRKRRDFKF